jgi:transglutaminase-like putative cysteine protease
MMLSLDLYLKPTPSIDCDSPSIEEKAQDLTKGQKEIVEKAKSLYYFVRDEIKYDAYSPFHLPEYYRASYILSRGAGFCVQKATLFAALGRAVGIPTRLRLADIRNYIFSEKLRGILGTDLFTHHGYDELYIGGRWVKASPILDLKMCQENGIIPVEFDGKTDGILHSYNQRGDLHIEYVRDHGHFADVPIKRILNGWLKAYGHERVEWMKANFGKVSGL